METTPARQGSLSNNISSLTKGYGEDPVEPDGSHPMKCRDLKRAPHKGVPFLNLGVPTGIRTLVAAVKGRCPWPLDDGDYKNCLISGRGRKPSCHDRVATASLRRTRRTVRPLNMVSRPGLEPGTTCLKGRCSTN